MIKRMTGVIALMTSLILLLSCHNTSAGVNEPPKRTTITPAPIVSVEPVIPETPYIPPEPTPNPCLRENGEYVHATLELLPDNSGYICNRCGEFVEKRYGFTDKEIYLLAQLLCGSKNVDGDGEYDFDFGHQDRYDQISLVLAVVMNRVRSDSFPDTVLDVVMARNQFSVMPNNSYKTPSEIALQRTREWCEAYDRWDLGVQSVPESHLYFSGNGIVNRSW